MGIVATGQLVAAEKLEMTHVPYKGEAGFPYIAVRGWAAISGPAGMPRDVVAKLSAAVNESVRMKEVQDQLALQGFPGKGSTPSELAEFTRAQLQSWAAGVKAAGIQPD